jgi:serine protease Do
MKAFRDVVGIPSKSTVRVYCDGEMAAFGTIVDVDGMVLTKASELHSESGKLKGPIDCELAEGSRYRAQLITTHQHTDLALLQLPTRGLPAIRWSSTSSPTRGSWVVTPGLGEQPEAIGVVSVTAHTVRGGVLGIFLEDVENGARVWRVIPGGGAAKAGIVDDDVISRVNGRTIRNRDELVAILNTIPPGETVQLTLFRGDQRVRALAELGSMNGTFGSRRALFQNALGSKLSVRKEAFPSVFEHDSLLNPDECGGPIVDLEGRALGINIARASRVSSYALPADIVRQALATMLAKTGDLASVSHREKAALTEASNR